MLHFGGDSPNTSDKTNVVTIIGYYISFFIYSHVINQ